MVKLTFLRILAEFLVAVSIALSIIGCAVGGGGVQNTVTLSYTFPFVPITFSIDSNGNISVNATANFDTEVGDFIVSVGSAITTKPVPANSLLLTIRHKQNGNLFDAVYQLNTGKVGSAEVQGNINEVKVAWDGQNNTVFIDASNGDITSIVIQGTSSGTTSVVATPIVSTSTPIVPTTIVPTNTPIIPTSTPTPVPAFQCPGVAQVAEWMGISVYQVPIDDLCAFFAGYKGQILRGVNCTNLDGGTTIAYNTVAAPTTLIIKNCDGKKLPNIYGFTIRFIAAYPSEGASVCAVATQATTHNPSNWTVQPQANC